MPYLNWKEVRILQSVEELPSGALMWKLSMSEIDLGVLIPHLEEIFLRAGGELRVGLPDEWAIFWKMNESGSRLLIAHPDERKWVATLALDQEHASLLLEKLKGLQAGQELRVSEWGGDVHPVSNLELVLIRTS